MIQNSNIKERKFELKGSDSNLQAFAYVDSTIYLSLDSRGDVFKFHYITSSPARADLYEMVGDIVLNKNIDDLIKYLGSFFFETYGPEKLESFSGFLIDQVLLDTRQSFLSYNGEVDVVVPVDAFNILCRCSNISFDNFHDSFIEHKGNYREMVRALKASVICGTCAEDTKDLHSSLEKLGLFYKGESRVIWEKKVMESLEEFPLFSPAEFNGVELILETLDFSSETPEVKFSLKSENDLSSFDTKKAAFVIMNYLNDSLKENFTVQLAFGTH